MPWRLPSSSAVPSLRRALSFSLALATALCAVAGPALADDDEDDDDGRTSGAAAFVRALGKDEPVFEEALAISSLRIERDSLRAELRDGILVPVRPEEAAAFRWSDDDEPGESIRPVMGAIFLGSGQFTFDAHGDNTEIEEMEWFIEEGGVDKAIDGQAILYFSSGQWEDISAGLEVTEVSNRQKRQVNQLHNSRWDNSPLSPARMFGLEQVFGLHHELFVLDAKLEDVEKGRPWLMYAWDDSEVEEVGLYRTWPQALNQGWAFETIASFHREEDRALSRRERSYQTNSRVDVDYYNMDLTVIRDEDTLDYGIAVDMTMDFTAATDDLRFVQFMLLKEIDVARIQDSNDTLLNFWHDRNTLYVELPEALASGQQMSLKLRYEGFIIESVRQPQAAIDLNQEQNAADLVNIVAYQLPVQGWFPYNSFDDRFTFDWIVRTPKPLIAATSGTLLTQEEEGRMVVATIKETQPVSFPIIVIGRFQVIDNMQTRADDSVPVIRIYAHQGFVESARSMIPEIEQIIAVYSEMFGEFNFPEIDIAQMPVGVGFAQAPAGIVRITGETYLSKTQLANFNIGTEQRDFFLPHELAHHWWGGQVAFWGDRDVWFHETMAEYAAALYLFYRDGEEGYQNRRASWPNRRGDNPDRTAALTVCTRRDQRTYQASVYSRGPMIMHKLRESLGHEAVVRYMYTLAEFGRNKAITTEDLQLVLETVSGMGPGSFETFFDYYVRGNFDLRRDASEIMELEEQAATPPDTQVTPPTETTPDGA